MTHELRLQERRPRRPFYKAQGLAQSVCGRESRPGILTESCFNKRPDARPHDAANRYEFIVADYYLLESLLVLAGELDPTAV